MVVDDRTYAEPALGVFEERRHRQGINRRYIFFGRESRTHTRRLAGYGKLDGYRRWLGERGGYKKASSKVSLYIGQPFSFFVGSKHNV